jgi:hypothetical protein
MTIDTLILYIIVSVRDGRINHICINKKQRVVEENPCIEVLKLIYEALIQTHGVIMLSVYTC